MCFLPANSAMLLHVGGNDFLNNNFVETSEVSLTTNQVCEISIPTATVYGSGIVYNGHPLYCGGFDKQLSILKSCHYFANLKWQQFPSLNTERAHFSIVYHNKMLWAIGGQGNNQFGMSSMERFDPVTQQWQTTSSVKTIKTSLQLPFDIMSACVVDTEENGAILIGGISNGGVS